jgi:phage host-nuclease inhibitor protein Gam
MTTVTEHLNTTPDVTADTDFAEAEAEHLNALRAEVDAADPGPLAQDDDTRTLYRYLRCRMHAVAELTTLKDQMAAMVKSAEAKVKALDYFFGESAARITAAKLDGGKSKSLKTPFGTVGFRTHKPLPVVLDEAAAIAALRKLNQPQCLATRTSIVKAALNDYVASTGEVPDGVDITDGGERFYLPK